MNLKTSLFITLFLCAIVLSHQETTDADSPSLIEQARATEKKAVAELKRQAQVAKAQFKAAYHKIRPAKTEAAQEASDSESSDSDNVISKAITEATELHDQVKQTEWTSIRDLKALYDKSKQTYKDAKAKLKLSRPKSSSSSSSDSSDSSDPGEGVADKAKRAAEWGLIAALKEKSNLAKAAVKKAYKLIRKQDDSSSSSSDSSDGTIKENLKEKATETVEEVAQDATQSVLEQAKQAQRAAYESLKAEARNAKESFQTAYRDLKSRIKAERAGTSEAAGDAQAPAPAAEAESSSSSSDSSDSDDGILKKARRYSQKLLEQAERAKNQAYDAVRNRGNEEAPPRVDTEL